MKITTVEIEGFRGYAKPYCFDFRKAQVVILYGPNGHGKTSLFDAIEWGLLGKLSRYDDASQERNKTRFLGNHFVSTPPKVTITLEEASGQKISVTRKGNTAKTASTDYTSGDLTLRREDGTELKGEEATKLLEALLIREEWHDKVSLASGLKLTNFLSQEHMSSLVRGMKDKERYDALSVLFGTEYYKRYSDKFTQLKRGLQQSIDQIKIRQQTLSGTIQAYNTNMLAYQGTETILDEVRTALNAYADEFQRLSLPMLDNLAEAKIALHRDRVNLNQTQSKITADRVRIQRLSSKTLRRGEIEGLILKIDGLHLVNSTISIR